VKRSDVYLEDGSPGVVWVIAQADDRVIARLLKDRGHDTWRFRMHCARTSSRQFASQKAALAALLNVM